MEMLDLNIGFNASNYRRICRITKKKKKLPRYNWLLYNRMKSLRSNVSSKKNCHVLRMNPLHEDKFQYSNKY